MTDELRTRVLADSSVPEAIRSAIERGLHLEEIRLDANGRWWHAGRLVEHPRVVSLFHRSIGRSDGGTWILEIPPYSYPILVDDTPYLVEFSAVDTERAEVRVRLNDESEEILDLAQLRVRADDRLVAAVKGGEFEARFRREPYHTLLQYLEEGREGLVLMIGEKAVPLTVEVF